MAKTKPNADRETGRGRNSGSSKATGTKPPSLSSTAASGFAGLEAIPCDGGHGAQQAREQAGSASPFYIADPSGEIIFANAAYRRLTPALAECGPKDTPADLVAEVISMGGLLRRTYSVEIDGQSRCYISEHEILSDDDGTVLALVGRYAPSGDLLRSQQALARSEERFGDIARLVSDWVWETRRDLTLTYVSHRVVDTLGRHPREFEGLRLEQLIATTEGSAAVDRALQSRAPFRDLYVSIAAKDGRPRLFRLSGLPVFCRQSGDFLGFRGTAQDVTQAVAHEAGLKRSIEEAEAANQSKSEFLANMSHELRTPLNAIIGFTEIMKLEQFGPIGDSRYREYAVLVLDSAHHLLNLINDILDVAKIEAGKLELNEESVEPAEIIRSVVRLMAGRADDAEITLQEQMPQDLPHILADERKLKQILLNLLSNAIKFTSAHGHVKVSAAQASDGGLCFEVSDTGFGIAPEDMETALSPFGQVDSGHDRKFQGTGLGLPLSKALTELHGGRLDIVSRPEEGTTVTVRLPATRSLIA